MIGYQVDIKGLEEQLAKLKQYTPIAERHLGRAMDQSVIEVASAVKPLAPVGVAGRLRNSIGSEVKRQGPLSIVGTVGSTLRDEIYPEVVEFGRKPGAMPPPAALERWVHLKLGIPNDEAPGVAFQIARAIGRRGTRGAFMFRDGWKASKKRVVEYFDRALIQIAEDLSNGRS